jgi:glycosyltransferase involved in cell wall biosynthesis
MGYLLTQEDPVHRIGRMSRALSPLDDLAAFAALIRFLRRVRPLIVHTHTAKAGVLGRLAAKLSGVPVIVHTFHGNVLDGYFPDAANRAIRWIEKALAGLSDAICAVSPQQQRELTERFRIAPAEKVRVVPLGLDLDPFLNLPQPPAAGPFTIGWLGRFVPIKNLPLLSQVLDQTLAGNLFVRFLIAGDGPERDIVSKAAARWGPERCQWLGWQQDVRATLQKCHVVIQTSRNEGTPVALIQAMAAGRPFISTAAGGVVDMVTGTPSRDSNGNRWYANAVLAEPAPGAFAAAIGELAGNPIRRRRMGSEAARFAGTSYSLSQMAANLEALYAELLSAKAAWKPVPASAEKSMKAQA